MMVHDNIKTESAGGTPLVRQHLWRERELRRGQREVVGKGKERGERRWGAGRGSWRVRGGRGGRGGWGEGGEWTGGRGRVVEERWGEGKGKWGEGLEVEVGRWDGGGERGEVEGMGTGGWGEVMVDG